MEPNVDENGGVGFGKVWGITLVYLMAAMCCACVQKMFSEAYGANFEEKSIIENFKAWQAPTWCLHVHTL